MISLQGKKCKKFNFFQNQNDTCAHPYLGLYNAEDLAQIL
jgi:hypothetical protein